MLTALIRVRRVVRQAHHPELVERAVCVYSVIASVVRRTGTRRIREDAEGVMWHGIRLVKTTGPDNDERPDHWAMKRIR